jgi:hypothetical protein
MHITSHAYLSTSSCSFLQGSSPIKVQTKGRFTIIEEEGSSPKLSFKLPSFGGSLSSQKSAAGAAAGSSSTNASPGTAAYKAASTPGMSVATSVKAQGRHCCSSCWTAVNAPSGMSAPAACLAVTARQTHCHCQMLCCTSNTQQRQANNLDLVS